MELIYRNAEPVDWLDRQALRDNPLSMGSRNRLKIITHRLATLISQYAAQGWHRCWSGASCAVGTRRIGNRTVARDRASHRPRRRRLRSWSRSGRRVGDRLVDPFSARGRTLDSDQSSRRTGSDCEVRGAGGISDGRAIPGSAVGGEERDERRCDPGSPTGLSTSFKPADSWPACSNCDTSDVRPSR